jgi:hypothetical protein
VSVIKFLMYAILLLLGLTLVFIIVAAGLTYYQFEYSYPRLHERNLKTVNEWNDKHWETGDAWRVTVQVSSDEALGAKTATATIDCYEKQFARAGGIKGPPHIYTRILSDGPTFLSVPFGSDATHQTRLGHVCGDASRKGDDWQLPHVIESHSYWSNIVANDQSFQCFLGNAPRTTNGKITRPTFIAIEKIALRDLLLDHAYESLPSRSAKPDVRPPKQYYWWLWTKTKPDCWRNKAIVACTPEIEAACGRPLP